LQVFNERLKQQNVVWSGSAKVMRRKKAVSAIIFESFRFE
jgi:hypothetical protein